MSVRILLYSLVLAAALLPHFARAQERLSDQPARAIVERAVEVHGGAGWLDPGTLVLAGEAEFYDPATGQVRSRADDYRMWREFSADRRIAHGAEGKVRIIAKWQGRLLFEIGYDGETTWTERGITPKAEADAYWASNFGFGIIRSALEQGFTLQRAPSRDIGGHEVDLVRVIDPQGQPTLFGFDRESGFIRYMAFSSPRGFHERIYDDFISLPDPAWVQARRVTLFYDGVMANRVFWKEVRVGGAINPSIFMAPKEDE